MNRVQIGVILLLMLVNQSPAQQWVKLEKVAYRSNAANDGDSFHVAHQGKDYFFRLYFADTPETQSRLEDRIQEQSHVFGISAKSVLKMGNDAEHFTKSRLSKPFTVWTRWDDAQGDSKMKRFFAFVRDAEGKDLAEELVANGWARVYGAQADHPDGPTTKEAWGRLEERLADAKKNELGCWNSKVK